MKQQLMIFLLFAGMAMVLRFFSFFPSVINHDESTYIVIANALLHGQTYFVDVIDTKPIGIFILMAGFISVFGKSIFVLRIVAALWIALTAFLLYLIQRQWGCSHKVGIATGLIYLFLSSIFTFYGVSPNTETYFNLFTLVCLWLILRDRGGWEYLLAGMSIGVAFTIKYVVAFDGLAFGLFLLVLQIRKGVDWPQFIGKALLLTTGFAMVFGSVYLYYWNIGELETFLFHSFEVPRAYPKNISAWVHFKFAADFFLRYLPITLFFGLSLYRQRKNFSFILLGSLWSILVLVVILIPGKFYGHYWVHFMLPFSFVAGQVFDIPQAQLPRWLQPIFRPTIGYFLMGVIVTANLILQKKDYYDKPDYPQLVAEFIGPQLQAGENIYTGNYGQVLYHLLDRSSPTKYVHPSLFWEKRHVRALNMDLETEIEKVKAAEPRFVLQHVKFRDDRFDDWLAQNYRMVKVFEQKELMVFERGK